MRFSVAFVVGVLCSAIAPLTTAAQSSIDPTATVVELRVSCAMPGGATLDNCFDTVADLTDWLWNGGRTSEPNSLDEVVVHVGPGEFDLFECNAATGMRGFVSVVGSGRNVTSFISTSRAADLTLEFAAPGGITVRGCTHLSFSDLTARGFGTGAVWTGEGDSFWEDVDLTVDDEGTAAGFGIGAAWYDANLNGEHWFWNMRFHTRSVGAYVVSAFNTRSESWIYGSDFLLEAGSPQGAVSCAGVLSGSPRAGGVHIFGSTVRARGVDAFSGMIAGLHSRGLSVNNPPQRGTIHMHGGIVNVNGPTAVGILTNGKEAFVHTPGTAFVLPGAGSNYRILDLGPSSTIQSPFLWPNSTQAPDIISSQDGADLFVKTNDGVNQDESHLYVYDSSCSAPSWRSVTTGSCL